MPMSKRMQLLIGEADYRAIRRIARRHGMTISEWVRQTLRAACKEEPARAAGKKLTALRAGMAHNFPTADIDQMLREIQAGYLDGMGR